jgi:hypothetical protein
MKRILLLLISYLLLMTAFAQPKTLDPKSDTSFWYIRKQQDVKRMGIADLQTSRDSLRFRLWIENQVIEIWTNDFRVFNGALYHFTETVVTGKKSKKAAKFFSTKTDLDTALARNIYKSFDNADMFSIGSDSKIPGWVVSSGGEELIFEQADPQQYAFKTFWTPAFQKNLPVAKTIEGLSHTLKIKLDLSVLWIGFINQLPPGCYHYGELGVSCREK